jgi:hypothetical protein
VHSPDPQYEAKLYRIDMAKLQARYASERFAFLYLDEMGNFRQPSVACDYRTVGAPQPLARLSCRPNTHFRIVAALNIVSGQFHYRQSNRISLAQLSAFYGNLRAAYPQVETI